MRKLLFTLLLFASAQVSLGQVATLSAGTKSLTIQSEFLEEARELIVYSPNFESNEGRKLPSIYLLDGRENFLLTIGLISNLVRADVIPPVNVIGIDNYSYDRLFDLTPPAQKEAALEGSGGGERFLDFLEKEVIPEVEKILPQSKFKVLVGHSLGGLFSTFTLINRPELFKAHISAGGSYWYDGGKVVDELDAVLKDNDELLKSTRLFFSLADETDSRPGFEKIETLLQAKTGKSSFERYDQADHVTGLTPALFNGLQYVFSEWNTWDTLYADINFEQIKQRVDELSGLFDMEVKPRAVALASYARGKTRSEAYTQAIEILEYLEQYYPEHIMVLNFLGEAWQKKGDFKKAKAVYERSLEVAQRRGSPMVRWINMRLAEVN